MERKPDRPATLQEAIRYFSDEQICIDTLAKLRWPDGVECPECLTVGGHYYLKAQKRWKCHECRRQFSVKLGTIFEESPIPLTKWLPAMWLISNCRNGVSSWELHRALGVTQKSAWFMLHRLRLGMQAPNLGTKLGGQNGGEVEADETFVGGKFKNMHRDRRVRFAQKNAGNTGGPVGKTAVLGMLDRESREVRAKVVASVKREVLQDEILKNVKYGSALYTDDAVSYDKLHSRYVHEVVNHAETYVRGRIHTNGLENFWSLLKRGLKGTYVAVEPFHLFRYVDEQVFRFNNRQEPMDDYARFEKALSQVAHRRLTYADLTGKNDTTTQF
jgi:transposase-like protein